MKILIIGGGSGDVGRDVTRILLKDKKIIDHITITSRNILVSQKFIENLDDPRVVGIKLDISDNDQLLNAFNGYDLIVNTSGPFSEYGILVMKAAIKARVNYIDICDDIEPTLEALQLDDFAKKAGIFIILGMGWFPGMSNLRAKFLADQMDVVEEIITAWVAGKKSSEEIPSKGLAGLEHFIKALTGKIITFRNGHRVKIPAYGKGVDLPFPEPLGWYTCYLLEHPETVTLPYIIPNVQTVSNLGSLYPFYRNNYIRLIARLIDFKLLSIPIATKIFSFSMQSKKKIHLPKLNGSYISCIGVKAGKKGQMNYTAVNTNITTAEATSQPLACTILYIAYNSKIPPGVHLPESILKIDDILNMGLKYNLSFVKDAKEKITWSEKVISIKNNYNQ